MKVLVACEESQIVTKAFRKLGHEAYSCDIEPCSGGHPEWHRQQDVRPLLQENWDLIIAFPPCTYFSTAGANWLFRGGTLNKERYEKGLEMKKLFMSIYEWRSFGIAIENPVSMKIWGLPKHTQEIQPFQFGDPYKKKTRLWLRGLPPLIPTNIVEPVAKWVSCGNGSNRELQNKAVCKSGYDSKKRSKTFQGIANAMAEQWGGEIK